jgi:hypothetical protein
MDINKIIIILVAFILLFSVFSLGMFVGERKANFSFRWAEQYHKNFAGPRNGFFQDFMGKDFMESNGTFGKIIQINEDSIIVSGRENPEKVISITKNTIIRCQKKDMSISDFKINDEVIIIGEPNQDGQIDAKLIRVMPKMNPIEPLRYE